jgi:hypothetical protein
MTDDCRRENVMFSLSTMWLPRLTLVFVDAMREAA